MSQTNQTQNCVTLSDVTVSPHVQSNSSSNLTHILDKIDPFDAELADGKHKNILIIGKRASGKSHMVKYLANQLIATNTVQSIIIITNPTNDYTGFKNVQSIYFECKQEYLKQIIETQSEPDSKPILIIFDDVLFTKKVNNNDLFKQIILNGRHFKISTIVTIQFPIGLNPEIRTNFDNVLMFYDDCISNHKSAWNQYFGMIPTFVQFNSMMKNLKLNNWECLCTLKNKSIPVCIYAAPDSDNKKKPDIQIKTMGIPNPSASQKNPDNLYNLSSNQQLFSLLNANTQVIAKLTNENNQISSIIKANNEIITKLIEQNNLLVTKLNLTI